MIFLKNFLQRKRKTPGNSVRKKEKTHEKSKKGKKGKTPHNKERKKIKPQQKNKRKRKPQEK